jgi:hypothetical protein
LPDLRFLRKIVPESWDEFEELFELELLEEFDELFELELLEEFDELFELELLDEFDELFELELPATCVNCSSPPFASSMLNNPSFGTPAAALPAVASVAPTIEAKKILRLVIFISLIRVIAHVT